MRGYVSSRRPAARRDYWNRLAFACAIDARLPQVRGRDRLLRLLRGGQLPRALHSEVLILWGPGLQATVNPSRDGSLRALYETQWIRPALVPVLEACLGPGDLFVDVGANIGIYASWAATIVGPAGTVLALEPVPQTRAWLEMICARNSLDQVEVLSTAIGQEDGRVWMQTTDGASGLSKVIGQEHSALEVPITTLDRLLGSRIPALIKIDVEGHELAVLRGSRTTLQRTRVPVVFEAPDFGGGSGTSECVRFLESIDYQVYSLTPSGIGPFDPTAYSHNLLAVGHRDGIIEHRLKGVRFPRSQNT